MMVMLLLVMVVLLIVLMLIMCVVMVLLIVARFVMMAMSYNVPQFLDVLLTAPDQMVFAEIHLLNVESFVTMEIWTKLTNVQIAVS